MAGPYVTGSGTGFPQTGSNRTRLQAETELAQYVGGETRGDSLTRCGQAWDAAVREMNSVAWKFNRVTQDILLDSTMLDNTAAPTISRDAGAGIGFTLATGMTITYWVEERVKDSGGNIIKRNFAPSTTTVKLTGDNTNDKPVVTRPATVNADTTHWALFGTATDGAYPRGTEIGEVAIATTTIEDTRTGNNPALGSGTAYEPGTYSVGTDFRNPIRGVLLDENGLEKLEIPYQPWESLPSVFTINDSTATIPIVYTIKNVHTLGKVQIWPRVRVPTNYPVFRLTYSRFIALAPGDNDRLNVPVQVDEAIFKLATANILSRVRSFEDSRVAFALATDYRSWVEQDLRDYPDFGVTYYGAAW